MAKKILKSLAWVAVIAFLVYTVIFGWGSTKDGSKIGRASCRERV